MNTLDGTSRVVCGLGQCSWDYLGRLETFPARDTKVELRDWTEQGGGPVATALVALNRLGITCRFAGVCGADEAGNRIRHSLEIENINIDHLKVRADGISQKAFIAVEAAGNTRTIFWTRPTARPLAPSEMTTAFLEGAAFLLLDGLMTEASLHAAVVAREAGIPVMLDAGRVREGILELASLCDYVVGSEEFARGLGFDGNIDGFREMIRGRFPGVFTFTLGAKGSVTLAGETLIRQEAFSVEAVDTTGAGDVFHGGYIYGLLQGWDLPATLRFASAFAALKCRRMGGRAGIPSLDETRAFLG